ncbi:MAG: hypothetical protein A2Y10_16175 [Planctomycetes bacterium GWF2_41_51]|nr:MAG: hypothetical protein A2Y10_16175 [Planctomycetes bacterium GWF2_41_51]HBG26591.1 hypothetical protein [Phycisphaerales bacterium]
MTDENQKNDLGDLSRNWHERLIQLRFAMAKNYGANSLPQPPQSASVMDIPPDNELFTVPVIEEPSAEQLFAGDESFYKNLETARPNPAAPVNPVNPAIPVNTVPPQANVIEQMLISQHRQRFFSPIQIVLAAAILLIAAMLLYVFFIPSSVSVPKNDAQTASNIQPANPQQSAIETASVVPQKQMQSQPQVVLAQPFSLKVAQTLYLNEDYKGALEAYGKLYDNLSTSAKEDLMRDYLQLQMALCMERAADYNQASLAFRKVLNSGSPAVRAVAFYHCGLLEMQKKQFLNARTKAYQALALIDAVDFDKEWTRSLKRDCSFLAAQSLTREVLSLCDGDKDLPENVWPQFGAADDIFLNIDETQLRVFLNSGIQHLNVAVLTPQIKKFDNHNGTDVYNITCSGASIEELLSRFAANAGMDSQWHLGNNDAVRKRLVSLHLLSAAAHQFSAIAAGSAGLVAQIDSNSVLNIYNPVGYSNTSQYLSMLSEEAVTIWQEFMLRFPEDPRLAGAHFALALLYVPQEHYTQAIAEYKLVANGFTVSKLAPYALLNSSRMKNKLQDFVGAYEDLKQLVEQFPDSQTAADAYLSYAETAGKANLLEESIKLYNKVYTLCLSPETQIAAALGAGKISYQLKDYKTAEKWLIQYTNLAASKPTQDLYLSYLYLGKTYLAMNNTDAACKAFQYALLGVPLYLPKSEYINIIPSLVEVYIRQESFVQALELLEAVNSPALSLRESVEVLILKSTVLRAMGLVDKALIVLGDRAEYMPDSQLKAQIYYQVSECYIEKGELGIAHKMLSDILVLTQPGPFMHKAALRLAEVCLKLDKSFQTVSLCRQLLDLQPSSDVKQKALEYLAAAYNQNENYDKAALALLGQWK